VKVSEVAEVTAVTSQALHHVIFLEEAK